MSCRKCFICVKYHKFIIITTLFLCLIPLHSLWAASTYSFTNVSNRGSHPNTLQYSGASITVDISDISEDAAVYRAIFIPHRRGNSFYYKWRGDAEKKDILVAPADSPNAYLSLRPPEYMTLDATKAVRDALKQKKQILELEVESFPYLAKSGWHAQYTDNATGKVVLRLDVTTDQSPESAIKQVSNINARHKQGSTMITWDDPAPLASSNTLPLKEFQQLRGKDENPREIRYRIYRHTEPITNDNIGQAELVGQTDAMSVWNWLYYAHGRRFKKNAKNKDIPRYPVDDGVLADYDMGMFVHHVQQPEDRAYYAVSRVIDGAEDLSRLTPGENTTKQGISEAPGPGMVLRRTQRQEENWYYVEGTSTLTYYVKWEAKPRFHKPEPFNYLVVVPENVDDTPPLSIALHSWGSWLNDGWLWAYNLEKYGAIHISTTQHPYDWWTGFHENLGTLKPLTTEAGAVQPFTQRRIRSFADDFVIPKWNVDTERILLHGASMGGSGTSLWGIKAGGYFANLTSKVGVHIPAESPTFKSSFEKVYGSIKQGIEFNDSGLSAWEYMDNVRWLHDNIEAETPHISFCNGKNDGRIGWPQAWKFVQALIETKRPFTFNWGMKGHGQRPYHMGSVIDFKLHQSLPAFSGGSVDDDIGSSPDLGDNEGQINYHYLWETDSIVDQPGEWAMTIYLRDKAPKKTATVNLTPRRLQQFSPKAGAVYNWTNTQNGQVIQEGTVTADEHGLVTLRSVKISKDKNRIAITPS